MSYCEGSQNEQIKEARPYTKLIKALINADMLDAPYVFTTKEALIESINAKAAIIENDEFEQLNEYPDYAININYPHAVMCIKTKRIIPTFINNGGYIALTLNHSTTLLHRLIALHFVSNPNGYNIVDHIDKDKQNNHIENLRWVSPKLSVENRDPFKNKSKKEYLDKLPENAIPIIFYGGFTFDRYWYDGDNVRVITYKSRKYRYLTFTDVKGTKSVNLKDINNVNHAFGMKKMIITFQKKYIEELKSK